MLIPVIWKCPDCQNINKESPSDSEKSVLRCLYSTACRCRRCQKDFDVQFKFRPAAYIGKIIEEEK